MGYIVSFFLGGMLGRVAGPIAQDYFENETKLGRSIQNRKRAARPDEKRETTIIETNAKLRVSEIEHQRKMKELQLQLEEKRKDAERQYVLLYTDANQKAFLHDCWPLRNPFDAPIAMEASYSDNAQQLKNCRLKTIMLPNKMEIVPLRFISALKNDVHPTATTVSSELSMFLANNYPSNGSHAVVSEIGAWKNEIPVNDASINYLFKGMSGQPVMVLAPEYTNGGSFVRFKVWSWGLGEELVYPVGFDFGWLDLEALYKRLLANEVQAMNRTLGKVKLPLSNEIMTKDMHLLSLITKNKEALTISEKERLLSLLGTPLEVNAHLRKEFASVISNVYSVIVAMYADGYHLTEYGCLPQLPSLLWNMKNIAFMMPQVETYYVALLNSALKNKMITNEQAVSVELELATSIKGLGCKPRVYEELVKDIRGMNLQIEGRVHNDVVSLLRELNTENNHKLIR